MSKGFSLIELLVSLLLSSIIILGGFTLYRAIHRSTLVTTALTQIQENGRFVSHLLNYSIRLAGANRCESNSSLVNQAEAMAGYSAGNSPSWLKTKVVKGSDVLVIGRCRRINGKTNFVKTAYFISPTRRHRSDGSSILALYQKRQGGQREEVAEGVSGLKLLYGVINRKNIMYLNAEQVKDWSQVKSVQYQVLLSSNNLLGKSHWHSYWFAGQWHPVVHWLNKVLIGYVALRER